MTQIDPKRHSIGQALGRVPSGVFILTTQHNGQHAAMMASWVQQVAFAPPMISVAVAKERPIGQLIRDSKRLAVSILGEDDGALMKKYARGIPAGEDPFGGIKTREASHGVMVLADALAFLDCSLKQVVDVGADHDLFVATIESGEMLREGKAFTHQRGNGFHY